MHATTSAGEPLEGLCAAALDLLDRPLLACHDETVLYVNALAARMLRASSSAEIIGLPIDEVLHPDFRQTGQLRRQVLLESKQPLTGLQAKLLARDGSTVVIRAQGQRIDIGGEAALVFTWGPVCAIDEASA